MNTKIASRIGILAMSALLAMPSIFAADRVTCNIPFAFLVGNKTLPAADYTFQIEANRHAVSVMGKGKNADAYALVITELAASSHAKEPNTRIVFDRVGDTYTLSEVWQPSFDGLLLAATKEKHEHHVIHAR
jgi:hypothetical protein